MRTPSSLRTLVPVALGSTLLLVGCSSGGGEPAGGEENPAPGQEASAEQPEQPAEEPAPAAVTNEQIRTAIEAIDVEGVDLTVTDSAATEGADEALDENQVEPAECRAALENMPGVGSSESAAVSGIANNGMMFGGSALEDAQTAEELLAAQEQMPERCAEFTMTNAAGETGEVAIAPYDQAPDGATGYTMTTQAGGVAIDVNIVFGTVGNAFVLGAFVPEMAVDGQQKLDEGYGQLVESLESQAG